MAETSDRACVRAETGTEGRSSMSKLLLIDGHSILNRAYFGLPDLTNSAGLHTNAVYGFLNIMFKFIETEQPDYLTVAFDVHAPTFRHKMYAPYKGTRKPMAEELRQQVPMMKQMLSAMGVTIVEKEGFEADDLLGTLARRAEEQGLEVTIVSGDRDLLQLATDDTKISIPKTKKTGTEIEEYYAGDVKEKYGVTPTEFIDVKALQGDTSDNIPGVPGIGEKTAAAIISAYGSIENAYAHAEELKPPRASKNLQEYYDQAVMSKTLATINVNSDISYDLEHAKLQNLYTEEAFLLCREWEFKNFLPRFSVEVPKNEAEDHFCLIDQKAQAKAFFEKIAAGAGGAGANSSKAETALGCFLLQEKTTRFGLALSDGKESALMLYSKELSEEDVLEEIKKCVSMCSGKLRFCARDLKTLVKLCPDAFDAENAFDAEVAAYLLNPLKSTYLLEDIAQEFLGLMAPSYAELFGKMKMAEVTSDRRGELVTYACYQAYAASAALEVLEEKLRERGMFSLYYQVELPLVFTLADMELCGIAMDGKTLQEYGQKLQAQIEILEKKIYRQAGREFNINSPKQLGVVLFEEQKLPGGKKTKTGYSTAADILEKLAPEYSLVADILSYRQLAKLNSTYANGLIHCLAQDGRVHSTFQQTVTATGRLSSTDPNLQNIPIRIELGRQIRKAFYPKKGFIFVDADYSQIELRVLAHMSGDVNLIEAYRQNRDIHRSTASLVFHTPFEQVTDLQRRNAKAVNFGIVYGISSFGLSQDLSITRKEAQKYIDDYFAAYPKMKEFLDDLVRQGRETGEVKTIFGRIRPIPELSSGNFMQRQFGERVAMNSPIQGTAADIIKIAMIRVHDRLQREGLESKLILQVHDELLIEAKEEELEQVKMILSEEMHGAAELSVPLEIDMHTGYTWYDAK